MSRRFTVFLCALLSGLALSATHNRAGEICYTHISGNTFEFTIFTYTNPNSPADRDSLTIVFDATDPIGSSKTVLRDSETILIPDVIKKNTYTTTWTYPGPGECYVVYVEDPNRVEGICNMDGSVNVPFYLEDTLCILNPIEFGYNSSPILTNPPIDFGEVCKIFEHNPNAYDPDGDSLHFSLIVPKQGPGLDVPGYQYPDEYDSAPGTSCAGVCGTPNMTIDPATGQLVWDRPCQECIYNVAILIREFRDGTFIGSKIRDLQIFVENTGNCAPEIEPIADTCVIAGESLSFFVTATDPNNDNITLSANGGPFEVETSPALFNTISSSSPVAQNFFWQTVCDHVRLTNYQVVFRAEDDFSIGALDIPLTDLEAFQITVVAPPPEGLTAVPLGNRIELAWDSLYSCFDSKNFQSFSVWRKTGCDSNVVLEPCVRGLDPGSGYVEIANVGDNHSYTDFGVIRGPVYSYRIVANFGESPDGSPFVFNEVGSRPSDAACAELRRDLPVLTNASVEVTDVSTGEIFVAWAPPDPDDLDTLMNRGPYRYELWSDSGFFPTLPVNLANFTTPFFAGYEDTTFQHTLINTQDFPHNYTIRFFASDDLGNEVFVGETTPASSIFLSIAPGDNQLTLNWDFNVPWTNTNYEIFKEVPLGSGTFEFLDSTRLTTYIDDSLRNGDTYCYFIRAIGTYGSPNFPDSLINLSQEACAVPQDAEAPCPPELTVDNVCNEALNIPFDPVNLFNDLIWTNPNNVCADDVLSYNIYFTEEEGQDFELLESIEGATDTSWSHTGLTSLAGCYAVTAIDSVGNESGFSNIVCVDNCPLYELPNVFTPNGDGANDVYTPFLPFRFISSVEMKIFNRWGGLVYETTDPAIGWDGTLNNAGEPLPEGVYYYVCNVVELRVEGEVLVEEPLQGYIHLIRGEQ
jgi:gliding motility-associated-like protein